MIAPPVLSLDGCTHLPRGHIAAVVTWLDMSAPPPGRPRAPLAGASLARLGARDEPRYTAVYRALGERWLWFSRLALSAAERAAILGEANVAAYAFALGGMDAGLLELDFRTSGEVELAFFGIVEPAISQGAGRWLLDRAFELAFARADIKRLFVHTCTFDHPRALDFYRASGFVPYKTAIEVTPDPRLSGLLPRGAAPHVPVIGVE